MGDSKLTNKVLLLGHMGKIGIALNEALKDSYEVIGKNTNDFDAANFDEVKNLIKEIKPDILINTVAFLGIDPCENEPIKALTLNTLYPKLLAELSKDMDFLLVHFSTDAVFNDAKNDLYVESDAPKPLNVYGFTKYGGDCFIRAIAKKYYIFRPAILFGRSKKNNQFVEKMMLKIKEGNKVIRVVDDIISSPSYSIDIANEAKRIIENSLPYGLYHLVNEGKASLFEIMQEIVENLKLDVKVEKASYNDFPYKGIKNTNTPLTSEKIKPMRSWKEAIKDYTNHLKLDNKVN
ncbi:MAG: NAD(P)-dependent oxidoreductase [Flavobacteriales bacterium]|jgi:dTDP-4-dehydrorhamnose reductase|nr:NAD(P)-dependent oxidoreductase [Flavobacteriales bacterium]|tara:strand:+ start:1364 stop:2239 length:876 start_codon:yes stop_codon:yes gene_type:complete